MARVRIYRQPKSAMQSGQAATHEWVLEFVAERIARPDPLMGWIGGAETQTQVRLIFADSEEALAYAARENLVAEVELPRDRVVRPKNYSDNFRAGRMENWTH